ncbi:MAG: nucleoside hydrolase [Actinomycetota bacterium]
MTSPTRILIDTDPGELTIVLLGPFTNMAIAMLMHPDLTSLVKQIVVMGGAAFTNGNASPASEANVLNDPEAADIVFGADCPIVMAGLDVTHQITMTSDDLTRFSGIPGARAAHLAAVVPYYATFYLERNGVQGIYVHDSTTISYLLAPELFTWSELPIRVDTGHSVCRGRTLPAFRDSDAEGPWHGRRPVRILTGVDSRAVIEMEFDHLSR